ISQTAALKLLQGYGQSEFKPDRLLTRAELAVVLARYLGLSKPGANFKSKFRDIEKHWARDAISALEEQGVVQGARGADGSVSFRPDEPIARGEAAAMIARLLGLKDPHAGFAGKLADIRGYWGKDYILALEDRGIVKGSPQGDRLYFRPTSPVSRAEAAVMVLRMASA
ncbi:MAG: S-layer homology domain-containing protein, partial [Actinobacteria bacterium]|nr:S-layer homology domain-containing protein [Actinomycetota bacterium]